MSDIENFVLQEWHVIAIFLTILSGIFKAEITSALQGMVLRVEQRQLTGQVVQLLSVDGSWKSVKILSYHFEVPFFKTGGVVIQHLECGDEFTKEKINFANWKTLRIRTKAS